jgi:hypothetical protein
MERNTDDIGAGRAKADFDIDFPSFDFLSKHPHFFASIPIFWYWTFGKILYR